MKTVRILALSMLTSTSFALSEDQTKAHHAHPKSHALVGKHATYSCDLIRYSGICRSYTIQPHQVDKVENLKEGCESMPSAEFKEQACPTSGFISKCIDIIRDHHHPDLIYDNHYYKADSKNWTPEEIIRVCKDLGGTPSKPNIQTKN